MWNQDKPPAHWKNLPVPSAMRRGLAASLDLIEVWATAKLILPGAEENHLAATQTKSYTSSPELYLVPVPDPLCLYGLSY